MQAVSHQFPTIKQKESKNKFHVEQASYSSVSGFSLLTSFTAAFGLCWFSPAFSVVVTASCLQCCREPNPSPGQQDAVPRVSASPGSSSPQTEALFSSY